MFSSIDHDGCFSTFVVKGKCKVGATESKRRAGAGSTDPPRATAEANVQVDPPSGV